MVPQTNPWCLTHEAINLLTAQEQIHQHPSSSKLCFWMSPSFSCSCYEPQPYLRFPVPRARGSPHIPFSFTQEHGSPLWSPVAVPSATSPATLLLLAPKQDALIQYDCKCLSCTKTPNLTLDVCTQLCSPCDLPPFLQGDLDSAVSGGCSS